MNIFLERNRAEFSNNVESAINLALSTKTRLLPNDNVVDNFSLFEQYNRERDECTKYRLIFNINPICSNVLYNARTEIILNEGSSDCKLLIGDTTFSKSKVATNAVNTTNEIDYMLAIRNTEYSHKENGGFIYHCGYDIFNNHMLRKKGFIHVNKLGDNNDSGENYNTIFDYSRDGNGKIVEEEIGISVDKKNEKTKMHLYQYDTIMSMPMAFFDNCIEKDGWWGFTNPNTIEVPNNSGNSISINRMLANNKACEFIDLYPDRSLFSFVPKFNKHRRRIEKNWDYCITYPYKSDYEMIDKVCGGEIQAIKANIKYGFNTAAQPIITCSSYFKHNLKPGEYVTFFYYMPHYSEIKDNSSPLRYYKIGDEEYLFKESYFDENGELNDDVNKSDFSKKIASKEFQRYSIKVKVESIGDVNGDNTDRVFTVKYSDISDIFDNMNYFGCFYKKNDGNTDCLYYFRKFKKVKSLSGDNLKSDVNKVAFGKNIYGDDMAQILFLDDLDIDGLLDNNGRPLSEVYLTVVKRNAGHKEWYNNNNFSGDTIEFSHCFGKITSGNDFCGIENEPFNYNIHYLHNMDKDMPDMTVSKAITFSAWGETVLSGMPLTLEDDITINLDEFYGDIVEYNIAKAKETIIGNVYHRFNTEQRETWNQDYQHVKQDIIVSDDYDYVNGAGTEWSAETQFINRIKKSNDANEDKENLMFGNIYPEGYFYNPHTIIKVRENEDIEMTSPAKIINYKNIILKHSKTYLLFKNDGEIKIFDDLSKVENEKNDNENLILQSKYEINIDTPVNYDFYKGDNIAFYNKKTMGLVWGEITSVSGVNLTIIIDGSDLDKFGNIDAALFDPYSGKREFYAYWSPNDTPIYAKLCEGKKKFVWRRILEPTKMMQDDELFETPFANGRFYLEKNINLFLKRQDPNGKYGLSKPLFKKYIQNIPNPMVRFTIPGNAPIDFSEIMFTLNNLSNNCY